MALARVAVGHSLLFQDAVHAHQRTSARILREQQRRTQATAASAPAAAGVPRSAPTASGSIAAGSIARIGSAGSMGSAGSGGTLARRSAQPGQASASAVAASTLDQQQQQQQQHAAGTAPAAAQDAAMARSLDGVSGASPGVRLRDDLSYEPMLHVGLEHGGNLGERPAHDGDSGLPAACARAGVPHVEPGRRRWMSAGRAGAMQAAPRSPTSSAAS